MAKIVITGGTSFLGSNLIKKLLREKHTVYALVRPNSKNIHNIIQTPQCKIICANLRDTSQWSAKIPEADIFLHLAWDGSGMQGRADLQVQEDNVEMALACLRAAAGLGVKRFIFFGSQAEYGRQIQPVNEDSLCEPVTAYGKAKLRFYEQANVLSKELKMEYLHLRIFSTYGPGDHSWTLVCSCLKAFAEEQDIPLSDCTQPWNFLYIDDFSSAVVKLCTCKMKEQSTIVNIAGDLCRPLREYVDIIWHISGKHGRPLYGARGEQLERPYGILPENKKLHQMVDWSQEVSFEEGIRRMVWDYQKEAFQ